VEADAELHPYVPGGVIGILTLVIDASRSSFPNTHEFIMDMRSLGSWASFQDGCTGKAVFIL
jgi:hypothetical protein